MMVFKLVTTKAGGGPSWSLEANLSVPTIKDTVYFKGCSIYLKIYKNEQSIMEQEECLQWGKMAAQCGSQQFPYHPTITLMVWE